jgi:hypothetical protein
VVPAHGEIQIFSGKILTTVFAPTQESQAELSAFPHLSCTHRYTVLDLLDTVRERFFGIDYMFLICFINSNDYFEDFVYNIILKTYRYMYSTRNLFRKAANKWLNNIQFLVSFLKPHNDL